MLLHSLKYTTIIIISCYFLYSIVYSYTLYSSNSHSQSTTAIHLLHLHHHRRAGGSSIEWNGANVESNGNNLPLITVKSVVCVLWYSAVTTNQRPNQVEQIILVPSNDHRNVSLLVLFLLLLDWSRRCQSGLLLFQLKICQVGPRPMNDMTSTRHSLFLPILLSINELMMLMFCTHQTADTPWNKIFAWAHSLTLQWTWRHDMGASDTHVL